MAFRIAAASTDGIHIDRHFGKAEQFVILEVQNDGSFTEIDRRKNPNPSDGVGGGCGSGGGCGCHGIKENVKFLADCTYVLAQEIGHRSTKLLLREDISALEVSLPIAEAIPKITAYENRRTRYGQNKPRKTIPPTEQSAEIVKKVSGKKQLRVAAASTDGKVINEHFGHASRFHVFELDEDGFRFVESRTVQPCCNGGEHSIESFEKVAAVLADCTAILVAKIGEGAASFLETKGLTVFESPFLIEKVLDKLVNEKLLEV
ncbi:MAG: hypothetical protein LUE11_01990 [Clostridia bacterium]|nr:hypothetical protein [Clostridia bacterium]